MQAVLISDKQLKLKCWEDHFTQLLNRPPTTQNKLKNGKVPGIWNITPEMLKAGGPAVVKWLTRLFHVVWSGNSVPEDWKKAILQGKW